MFVQLSCAVVDPDAANRQEMSNFLTGNGVNVVAALASLDQLQPLLHQGDPPRLAMINIHRRLRGTPARMLLTVHDELVFELPTNDTTQVEPIREVVAK